MVQPAPGSSSDAGATSIKDAASDAAARPDGAPNADAGVEDTSTPIADATTGSSSIDASVDRGATNPTDAASEILPRLDAGTITIMAVGDSITHITCWRALLWRQLNAAFPSRFHLVGTLTNDPGCGFEGWDMANQGYSSSLVTEVVAGVTNARTCDPFCPTLGDFSTAFETVKPDVILMHYGTNDVWNSKAPADILTAYGEIIDAARAARPSVVVLLAELIPMDVTAATCSGCSCPSCSTAVPALNAQMGPWAAAKSTAASPVVVVDQYTGFDAVADTRDGVHPNDTTGSTKMANKWFAALTPLF
jgi:lysophospholipase L1-like esterase